MKVLVVGLGSIGQRHMHNLQYLCPDAKILAYRVRNNPVDVQYTGYETLDKALDKKPDAAFICNFPNMHVGTALKIAERKIPFLIEKPLSHTTAQVEDLIKVVEANRLPSLVGYQMRFHPDIEGLKEFIYKNGPVHHISAEIGSYLPRYHPYEDYKKMYEAHSDVGGGVLLSLIHEFDYVYSLIGMPKTVYTIGGHLSKLDIHSEDVASTLLDYGFPVHIHQNFVQENSTRTITIVCEKNSKTIDLLKGVSRDFLFISEMRHFLDCVAGLTTPRVTVRQGFDTLKIALAAKYSLEMGRVVRL